MIQVNVVRAYDDPSIQMPVYGTDGAGAFDLFAHKIEPTEDGFIVDTGLIFEIPEGHVMFIKSRSGLSFKKGITAFHGVIDSDYRGVVKVKLTQRKSTLVTESDTPAIVVGDRIAQAYITAVPKIKFNEVTHVPETERGTNGFGSTGS